MTSPLAVGDRVRVASPHSPQHGQEGKIEEVVFHVVLSQHDRHAYVVRTSAGYTIIAGANALVLLAGGRKP